ncbi:MAG: T9SS type A sorting domain-containing protein [Bacteroidota bacterium]
MKTLAITFIALLFSSLAAFANNDEAVFSASVESLDALHTRIEYNNASAPVQITVFNEEDGVVFSKSTSEGNYTTDLNLLDFNSGNYTVVIETENAVVTRQLSVNKSEIKVQVTLLSENDGIVSKQIATADNLEGAFDTSKLDSGKYTLLIESNDAVLTEKVLEVK